MKIFNLLVLNGEIKCKFKLVVKLIINKYYKNLFSNLLFFIFY